MAMGGMSYGGGSYGSGGGGGGGGTDQIPNHVLIVSILNARVPVTLENLHDVFKTFGEVKKIITFVKDGVFKRRDSERRLIKSIPSPIVSTQ